MRGASRTATRFALTRKCVFTVSVRAHEQAAQTLGLLSEGQRRPLWAVFASQCGQAYVQCLPEAGVSGRLYVAHGHADLSTWPHACMSMCRFAACNVHGQLFQL